MGRLAHSIIKTSITFTIISLCAGTVAAQPVTGQPTTAQPIIAPVIGGDIDESSEAIIQETVVIHTYADSLRIALAQKHHAENIIEVLFAEEVGKLPDISIVESLARLPGVTADRTVVGAGNISVRGMGPVLVNGTLNGREVVTPLASRNIQYDQYPSELITGAAVYKSSMASIVEGGVAGTINLTTIKPLDYDDRLIAINLRGTNNEYGDSLPDGDPTGFRGGVSYIDQFLDGTLGVALGYADRKNPFTSLASSNFTYRGVEGAGDGSIPGLPAGIDPNNTVYLPFGYDYGTTAGEDSGDGALVAIQWAPSEAFELNFDTLYSTSDTEAEQWGMRADGIGSFGNTYVNGVFQDNAFIAGTIVCNVVALALAESCTRESGMDLRVVNELFEESSDLFAGGINAKWFLNNKWTVNADLGYSKATQSSFLSTVSTKPFINGVEVTPAIAVGVTSAGAPFLVPTNVPDGLSPIASTATAADFSDPATNRITGYRIFDDNDTDDELIATAIDVSRPVDGRWVNAVQVGLRFADRDKEFIARDVVHDLATPAAVPANLILATLISDIDSDFRSNPILRLNTRTVVDQLFGDVSSEINPTGSWRVEEKTRSAYVQIGFESSNSSFIPYSGNIGFRAVQTETLSSGTAISPGTGLQIFVQQTKNYTDVLPSLNVSFYPENFIVRLALSKTIARPAINQLNPGFDQSSGDTLEGGNPLLEPYRTTNLDFTLEKYWGEDTALTLALFYKNLESFIARQQELLDTLDGQVLVNRPVNGDGGHISGFEVLYQKPFSWMQPPFDGFGIYANYSVTQTSVDNLTESFNPGVFFSLDGVSKNVGNLTLWYSKYGIDARLSYRFRDDFTREQRHSSTYITNDAETVVDFQFTYDMAGLGIEGLDVFLQANNLTNEPSDSYYGNPAWRGQYRKFGRNYSVGFTYKLNAGTY